MADLPNCTGAVIKGGGLGKKCSRLVERDHMVKGVIFVKAIPKYTTLLQISFLVLKHSICHNLGKSAQFLLKWNVTPQQLCMGE